MAKVTIFGAGITGLAIATQLPKSLDITIVASDLPTGSTDGNHGAHDESPDGASSAGWASPWACAGWVAMGGTPREQRMQLDALTFLLRLAKDHPDSSARRATMTELYDAGAAGLASGADKGSENGPTASELWYHERVPGYRVLDPAQAVSMMQRGAEGGTEGEAWQKEDGNGKSSRGHADAGSPDAKKPKVERSAADSKGDKPDTTPLPPPLPVVAVSYTTAVVTPSVILPWLRRRLEAAGVKFQRISKVSSLAELGAITGPCDILVNASGVASATLTDVHDSGVITDRTYVSVVKSDYKSAFVRRGAGQYTYIFGRADGTAAVGGFSEPVVGEPKKAEEVRKDLISRAHENLPGVFPSNKPEAYVIVQDLIGIRPMRLPEVRVEKELIAGQKVVHAYGTTWGGYLMSFGVAREAAKLVDEFVFEELE